MQNLHLLISSEKIQRIVQEVGNRISHDYECKDLVLVGVLKGSFIFLADLTRQIKIDHQIDFIGISSYEGENSTGAVKFTKEPDTDLKGKDVLLVEDIIDTGLTIIKAIDLLQKWEPASIKICALINKQERREKKIHIDYTCFFLDKGFILGYGLDYDEKYRNLPDIFIKRG